MISFFSLKLFFLIFSLFISINCSKEQKFMMDLDNIEYSFNYTLKSSEEILNVRCYWIKGFNVYDVSELQKTGDGDWNFTTSEGSTIYYNFCANTKTQCKDSTNSSMIIGYDLSNNCKRFSGNQEKFNKFNLLNSTDSNGGLSIEFSSGEACPDESGFYSVTFELKCDPTMKRGIIEFSNEKDFSMKKCRNVLNGRSFESCPKINYYIIQYFLSQYGDYLGGLVIALGVFLVLFGVKFIKVTIVVSGIFSMLTLTTILFFNVFQATSTQTVWIVMGVGAILGLALGILLIKMTRAFFMIVGGYMGYLVGIFLYDVGLQYIEADPKVIYWVTIVGSIVLCAFLALWLVKHALIIATSICGSYAVIRGASLYIGHFPSETVIMDLIEHKEYEQLQNFLDTHVYVYLSLWVLLAIFGIWFQYRANAEKESDDYRKM